MNPAFGRFDEPHAWLIRGLVEYGWPDLSRSNGHVPPGVLGGINLAGFADTEGRRAFLLDVPAAADGHTVPDDLMYSFEAYFTSDRFIIRCPEANFFQEFGYDRNNPLWAAGYIHQAISAYVPEFVRWRLGGGSVGWAERAGVPEVEGDPASPGLCQFVRERVNGNRRFDAGPMEGWWMGAAPAGPTTPIASAGSHAGGGGMASLGAIASVGKGEGPTFMSAAGRAQAGITTGKGGGKASGGGGGARSAAITSGPGTALMVMTGIGVAQGGLWLINALSVAVSYREYLAAGAFSVVMALGLMGLGALSMFGALKYKRNQGGPMPFVAIAYVSLLPFCCLVGLPIGVWAAITWRKPEVRALRG